MRVSSQPAWNSTSRSVELMKSVTAIGGDVRRWLPKRLPEVDSAVVVAVAADLLPFDRLASEPFEFASAVWIGSLSGSNGGGASSGNGPTTDQTVSG